MAPQLIFGTATLGMDKTDFQDAQSVQELLRTLRQLGISRLDSGARYPPLKPGMSEELIGKSNSLTGSFLVDTKVYTDTRTDGSGDLSHAAMKKSVDGSLERLQHPINVLHIHRADPSTPLEEQVENFNEQIKLGHCRSWGVSNVPMDTLEKIINYCTEKGLQKPTCYQGVYNLVTRGLERKLLSFLRTHGMAFNALSPLGAGFLTGNFVNNQHEGTRFSDDNPLGKFAQKLYGAGDLHTAMKKFDTQVRSEGFTSIEVAARWISHHSALKEDDTIILGASSSKQIEGTASMIQKGPLPQSIQDAADELWNAVELSRGDIV